MDDSDTQPKGVRACEPTWCRYLNKKTVKGFFLRCTALSSFKVGEMELLREKTGLRKTERETERDRDQLAVSISNCLDWPCLHATLSPHPPPPSPHTHTHSHKTVLTQRSTISAIKINKIVKINLPATGNTYLPCLKPPKIWELVEILFSLIFMYICNRGDFQPDKIWEPVEILFSLIFMYICNRGDFQPPKIWALVEILFSFIFMYICNRGDFQPHKIWALVEILFSLIFMYICNRDDFQPHKIWALVEILFSLIFMYICNRGDFQPPKIWEPVEILVSLIFMYICNRGDFQPPNIWAPIEILFSLYFHVHVIGMASSQNGKKCPVSLCRQPDDVPFIDSELLNCRRMGKYVIPELGQLCKQKAFFSWNRYWKQKQYG